MIFDWVFGGYLWSLTPGSLLLPAPVASPLPAPLLVVFTCCDFRAIHGHLSPLVFVIGLLPSEGNTTIPTIIDWFSKAVNFVPLVKLPLALETATLLVYHVFHLHGIPLSVSHLVSSHRPTASRSRPTRRTWSPLYAVWLLVFRPPE